MFRIERKPLGPYTEVFLTDEATGAHVSFVPDFGATLNKVVLPVGDGKLQSFTSSIDSSEELSARGGHLAYNGSLLFPYPNRVKDGIYKWNDKEWRLPINHVNEGHSIHGQVYDKVFRIAMEETTPLMARVVFEFSAEDGLLGFPWPFHVEVEVIFSGKKGLFVKTTVTNTGTEAFPYGIGWHPYFSTGTEINKLHFQMPAEVAWRVDDRMIPTLMQDNCTKFNSLENIGDTELDTCFSLKYKPKEALHMCELADPEKNCSLLIGFSNCQYLQVYTPSDRMRIAIEPQTAPPDMLNHGIGRRVLEPKDQDSIILNLIAGKGNF